MSTTISKILRSRASLPLSRAPATAAKHRGLQSTNGSTGIPQSTSHQNSSHDTTQKTRGEATLQDRAESQQAENNSRDVTAHTRYQGHQGFCPGISRYQLLDL
ncbi:hypothetical protein M438DRAFT_340098 [Aureobasidium pullulans EXF-150]|uniref:Uncharacterized protein n=1 Tax=Aureobasidium pullulans EXF-150 TaxID=1043002 RepID=A0A074XWI7_AURPU|nr:uncharacterized protein M438DRAFT_340098 [Aureobasidium pullulans EXF-150]KEQ79036.1 hypothetical protein M438DRAFT_340098 [Aureobasidium pullulans EXF-150]